MTEAPVVTKVALRSGGLPDRLAEDEILDRILLVVAHPDDESIGAGALLRRAARRCWVLHLTDGAPVDPHRPDRQDPVRLAYAELRRKELHRALDLAGIPPARRRCADAVDQEATSCLPRLVGAVLDMLEEVEPDVVLTHPYEGGHPDHDAAAFAVHMALALRPGPVLLEMAYYHGLDGRFVAQDFLPGPPAFDLPVRPSDKARLLACHASQRDALAPFSPAIERLRIAPRYDFLGSPHPGPLWYERQGWGDSTRFRAAARAAIDALLPRGRSWP